MAFHKNWLLLLSIAYFATLAYTESPGLLIELFRHGARAPESLIFDADHYWANGPGQLTPVGMRMHYVLGAAMRQKYPELLSKYDPEKVYVRSSDVDRTIMSAYAHMQGIFQQTGPEMSESIDLSELGVKNTQDRNALPGRAQAVPIYSLPLVEDHSLKGYHLCARQAEWRLQNLQDSQTSEIFNKDMAELVQHLSENNVQVGDYALLGRVAEITLSNKFENIKLPAGIAPESQFFKDLKFVYEFYYTKTVEALPIQRALYAKPLLVSILEYIDDFLADRTPRNAIFLSAHDTTLMTLLAAFNITNTECLLENYRNEKAGRSINYPDCVYPQYASNMIFEVYKAPEPSLALFYDGKPINICGKKSNRCSVKDFINYATQVTDSLNIEDYLGQCDPLHFENQTTIQKGKQSRSRVILQTLKGFTNLEVKLMIASVVLSLLIVCHWFVSQRNENANEKIRPEDIESVPSSDNEIVVNVAQAAQES